MRVYYGRGYSYGNREHVTYNLKATTYGGQEYTKLELWQDKQSNANAEGAYYMNMR